LDTSRLASAGFFLADLGRGRKLQYRHANGAVISDYYPLFILLAPLAAALAMIPAGRAFGFKASRIGVAAEAIALGLAVFLLYDVSTGGPKALALTPARPVLQLAFHIDRLSSVMLVHIAAISTLIHLFSVRYMQQERGYLRFHSLLAFTTFVLFGMVASANLLMLFAFWQLLTWLVPLLSYNYGHPPTVRGAFRTFIMHRAGDFAFLVAIVLAYRRYGSLEFDGLFSRAASLQDAISIWPAAGVEIGTGTAITLLIFVGAMSKSAQVPLHMWLPDSLYAPTPVHALLHAGIINAGGFLLTRLAPLYDLNPATLHVVFATGMLTTLLGSSMMLVQNDIKKTLGYSTIGQMGFMIMECGLGAYSLAIFHLIAHGLFKATIFLNCGYVIHAARQEPRLPPRDEEIDSTEFSTLTWITGFFATLILPLIILLAAHGLLRIPLRDAQGTAIFLFFGWATSSQAILTLYRLRAAASWKVAASMLGTLFLVIVTYLLAAESFTHFLFPTPGEVSRHFRAGALPAAAFDGIVVVFSLIIVISWMLIYAKSHGRTIRMPQWLDTVKVRIYLLLINRLYLDAVARRLVRSGTNALEGVNASRVFSYLWTVLAIGCAGWFAADSSSAELRALVWLIPAAILLPLFPLHALFVAALTRAPASWAPALGIVLPTGGLFVLAQLGAGIPIKACGVLSALAVFGALYAALRALTQRTLRRALAETAVVFCAAVWWSFAAGGSLGRDAILYAAVVILLTAGLLLVCQRLQQRCGDLTFERMYGLAGAMPRLATIFGLLIMAAIALPPFGLFSASLALLLESSAGMWSALLILFCTYFLTSWHLFRGMQRLLFGPERDGLRRDDLTGRELASFVVLLALLVIFAGVPFAWIEPSRQAVLSSIRLELPWPR
jgi:NADH-quinone oxidoreductase subunit L